MEIRLLTDFITSNVTVCYSIFNFYHVTLILQKHYFREIFTSVFSIDIGCEKPKPVDLFNKTTAKAAVEIFA